MKRALFLDRDGIFNALVERDGGLHSPRNWQETEHFDGLEALSSVRELGFQLILITNQPDIERGIVPESFCRELHDHYLAKYTLDAVYVCPFASAEHPWKKPNPGMFLQAAQDLGLDLKSSFHLGDTQNDVTAAERVGITPILWNRPYNRDVLTKFRVDDLAAAIEKLRT